MKTDVIKYEKILNESEQLFEQLLELLERINQNQKNFDDLKGYYGSEEYRKDVALWNDTHEYDDIACGVLTEDLVYDLIGTSYNASIEMLETATKILKNY